MSGKQVHYERTDDPHAPALFTCGCTCVCACLRGFCLCFEYDSVYSVGPGTLRWSARCALSGESAHMCLHEDLVLCGCVFDKL